MRSLRSRPLTVLVVAGLVLAFGGAAWFVSIGSTELVWFSYVPMSEGDLPDGVIILSVQHRVALVLLALGALLLSVAGGFALGRRSASPPPPPILGDRPIS